MRIVNKSLDVHKMLETNMIIFKENLKAIAANCIERIGSMITEPAKLSTLIHRLELQTPDIEVIGEVEEEWASERLSRAAPADRRGSETDSRSRANRLASSVLARESMALSGNNETELSAEWGQARDLQSRSLVEEASFDPLAKLRSLQEGLPSKSSRTPNPFRPVKNFTSPVYTDLFPKTQSSALDPRRDAMEPRQKAPGDGTRPEVAERRSELEPKRESVHRVEPGPRSGDAGGLAPTHRPSPSVEPHTQPADTPDRSHLKSMTKGRRKGGVAKESSKKPRLPSDFLASMKAKITRLESHAAQKGGSRHSAENSVALDKESEASKPSHKKSD